jgi:uncharacterized protein (DUF849 family)
VIKTIIACAVTGAGDTVRKNPAVPVTPAQIAASSIEAAKAGAAIVHIHVRDPANGAPSMEFAHYAEVVDRIKYSGTDVIINLTTGAGARYAPSDEDPRRGGPGTTIRQPLERMQHVLTLKPEICSLDMGTINMGATAFINTPAHLATMAKAVQEAGVVPELEVFEAGHIELSRKFLEDGVLRPPAFFQICLGVAWAQPATPRALTFMRGQLPPNANWFAFGVGAQQFPIAVQAFLLGGHVRVGLEDNLYLARGLLAPSNAALVQKAAHLVSELGGLIATPAEARVILGLSKGKEQ